jgi:hypothetical protein
LLYGRDLENGDSHKLGKEMKKRHIEYKKIALTFIVLFSVLFIAIGRIAELFGIIIDSSVDTALVYTILGSFASYCVASASDKYGMNKYGHGARIGKEYEKGDGTE